MEHLRPLILTACRAPVNQSQRRAHLADLAFARTLSSPAALAGETRVRTQRRHQMDLVRFGIIGAGGIATHFHLPAVAKCPGAKLVAVADVLENRARLA